MAWGIADETRPIGRDLGRLDAATVQPALRPLLFPKGSGLCRTTTGSGKLGARAENAAGLLLGLCGWADRTAGVVEVGEKVQEWPYLCIRKKPSWRGGFLCRPGFCWRFEEEGGKCRGVGRVIVYGNRCPTNLLFCTTLSQHFFIGRSCFSAHSTTHLFCAIHFP